MNTEEWGVTERGFHRPAYTELLDALEYKAREFFGASANLTVRSPLGVFLRIFAWMLNILFSLAEEVYNSRFVDTAVGASLYNLGKSIGLQLLPAQKATGYVTFTGAPGTVIPVGFLVRTVAGLQYAVLTEGRVGEDGTVILPVQAVGTGKDYNTAAGTVREITNPLDGVDACINDAVINGGQGRETDEEFRDRYFQSVDYAGGVNVDAIVAEILQNVEAVYSATGYENETDYEDEYGLPPHSFEILVYGGLDQEVARAIYRKKGAGIQTHGNRAISVLGKNGKTYIVKFSRPTEKPVYVKVENLKTSSAFPSNGKALIAQALVAHIGGDATSGLSIGQDVLYMAIPGAILAVPGVVDFDLTISADGETYAKDNISVDTREKAVTDEGKVTVA